MPSQTDLARMQQTARARMPTLATIERLAKVADGYGGETKTYAAIYSDVPCRIDNLSQNETPSVHGAIADFKISFPAGTDIVETDRILIEGKRYAVFGVIYKKSYEITRDVEVKRV